FQKPRPLILSLELRNRSRCNGLKGGAEAVETQVIIAVELLDQRLFACQKRVSDEVQPAFCGLTVWRRLGTHGKGHALRAVHQDRERSTEFCHAFFHQGGAKKKKDEQAINAGTEKNQKRTLPKAQPLLER